MTKSKNTIATTINFTPTTALGTMYKDTITGFKGVCTAKIEYLSDNPQSELSSKVNKDGEKFSYWFNNKHLEVVKPSWKPKAKTSKTAPAKLAVKK